MATVETLGRVFEFYRRTAASRSAIALLIANAIPLVGVLFFDWSLWTILVVYWLENGIVGFWNVPRMLLAGGPLITEAALVPGSAAGSPATALVEDEARGAARVGLTLVVRMARAGLSEAGRAGLVGFFLIHYGVFWVVHGVFVLSLPEVVAGFRSSAAEPGAPPPAPGAETSVAGLGEILWPYVVLAAVALFISHGASFFLNYVGRGEYRRTSPTYQMMAPYPRLIVLHLTILIGGVAIATVGAPIAALVIMIVLKTFFDLSLHLLGHFRRSRSVEA